MTFGRVLAAAVLLALPAHAQETSPAVATTGGAPAFVWPPAHVPPPEPSKPETYVDVSLGIWTNPPWVGEGFGFSGGLAFQNGPHVTGFRVADFTARAGSRCSGFGLDDEPRAGTPREKTTRAHLLYGRAMRGRYGALVLSGGPGFERQTRRGLLLRTEESGDCGGLFGPSPGHVEIYEDESAQVPAAFIEVAVILAPRNALGVGFAVTADVNPVESYVSASLSVHLGRITPRRPP